MSDNKIVYGARMYGNSTFYWDQPPLDEIGNMILLSQSLWFGIPVEDHTQ